MKVKNLLAGITLTLFQFITAQTYELHNSINFNNVDDGRNVPDGISWYQPNPLAYGIYRTSGTWNNPDFQQLKISFETGVIIDGGQTQAKSGTFIQPNGGNVGIGTLTPTSKLEVFGTIKSYQPTPLGSVLRSSHVINEVGGSTGISNKLYRRLWLYRDTAGSSNWWTARLHDGIAIDASFNTPSVDTKTWWERDPLDNIQSWGNDAETYFTINKGQVGIGMSNPFFKLDVNGTIHSKEVRVDMTGWPDFVFTKEYDLPTLQQVEKHIVENGHLPNVPNEEEVRKYGLNLGEMNATLLQKIEEITLYLIQQSKRVEKLEKENNDLQNKLSQYDEILLILTNK